MLVYVCSKVDLSAAVRTLGSSLASTFAGSSTELSSLTIESSLLSSSTVRGISSTARGSSLVSDVSVSDFSSSAWHEFSFSSGEGSGEAQEKLRRGSGEAQGEGSGEGSGELRRRLRRGSGVGSGEGSGVGSERLREGSGSSGEGSGVGSGLRKLGLEKYVLKRSFLLGLNESLLFF